jgi:hypothetical protein
MKVLTALEMGQVREHLAYEQKRTILWRDFSAKLKDAAENIVEAAIVILVAAVFIAAVVRLHESCKATAYFNEAIANTVLTVGTVN